MKEVDTQGLVALQREIITEQEKVPADSLDWSIYQGRLDLLERVGELIGIRLSKADVDKQRFREWRAGKVYIQDT